MLIDVSRCGICGSDLHARVHADEMAELAAETGYRDFMRSHQRVVLGHEFSGTVAGYGPAAGSGGRWVPRWWRCRSSAPAPGFT